MWSGQRAKQDRWFVDARRLGFSFALASGRRLEIGRMNLHREDLKMWRRSGVMGVLGLSRM